MFLEYYGLREQPFGVTPDPRFIYFGPAHREALASLLYAIEAKRGFSAMVAEPGMGKTSLLFRLLESLRASARTAFLFQTDGDSRELLRGLLSDLGIKSRGKGVAAMHCDLNKVLLEEMQAGRKTVLVIDEAQNLDESALESIRLLSNFETATDKLMHIVLAGQPKLADTLTRTDLVQLRQRVSTIIQLRPFQPEEVAAYVKHRLRAAGYEGPPMFSSTALQTIARVSRGVPRDINSLCFQALSIGFAMQTKTIGSEILREAVADFDGAPSVDQPAAATTPRAAADHSTIAASPSSGHHRDWNAVEPPALERPAPVFWNYDPTVPEPIARRGNKGKIALTFVVVLLVSIIVFSDPSLGLTTTAPGRISSHIVDAVLNSGDPNSDFVPALPNALKPPTAPPIQTTQDALQTANASQQAQTQNSAPNVDDTAGNAIAPADLKQTNNPPRPLPQKTERPVERRRAETPSRSENVAYVYEGPSIVHVERRENLFEFSLEMFGRSNWPIVEKLCELNPTIRGPYAMLSEGQRIRVPREIPADPPKSKVNYVASGH
jgi:type II secretory pathway predicted ATPase ExeA